ncbi:MAG: ABC transporter ATP-binding protein [Hyphomicrobiaceae bacterium]|nr:ABC transporter ATP-binding protein [Hyphomicrobiaceae bacterium]
MTPGSGPLAVEVQGMSKRFGGLQALDNISLAARGGEVTAVIGPNGAGKSTLLDCLTGVTRFDSGRIIIDGLGHDAVRLDRLVDLGISRTFQHVRLFESLTALEHLVLVRRNLLATPRGRARSTGGAPMPEPMALLERVGLLAKAGQRPAELAYGERRRLEIARALATAPRFLLLDEPAAGSTPSEQNVLAELIRSIAADGVAVVLVEHHMDLVGSVSARVVVINFGRHVVTGTIEEIRRHPEVISAYLGVAA